MSDKFNYANPMADVQPGRIKEISSTSNPIIKEIKGLALKKNRDAQKLFMAEGLKLVTDAIDMGWKIRTLVYGKQMAEQEHLAKIAQNVKAQGAYILEVTDKVLTAISRKDNPQMVIGIFEQQWHSVEELSELASEPNDVLIALDRVRDPGNLGTIIRTGDASGVKGLILVGETTDPYSLEAVRATMGSIFNMKIARVSNEEMIAFSDAFKGQITGTHLEGAVDYRTIDYKSAPQILFMGNEQKGLPPELTEVCSQLAFIPMAGKADSLNLAISTGIMLFEMRRDNLKMPTQRTNEQS
ncbi:MAG: TrmH family RNA methyltransferase [Nitratireductor sp.]